MAPKQLFSDGLSQDVSRVTCAEHLRQDKVPLSDPLLDPQLPCGQVADLADAGAPTDPYGSTAIGTYFKGKLQAEVCCQAAHTEALRRALDDPGQFSLPRAERNGLLGDRPMLQDMRASAAQPA